MKVVDISQCLFGFDERWFASNGNKSARIGLAARLPIHRELYYVFMC
jgi:hypothetical protein